MKLVNKGIIFFTSSVLGIFNVIITNLISTQIDKLTSNTNIEVSKIYILIYIISALLIISVSTSIIFNTIDSYHHNSLAFRLMIQIVNAIIMIISLFTYLIVKTQIIQSADVTLSPYENSLFLMLLQSIVVYILPSLSYTSSQTNSQAKSINQNESSLIKQEIEDMKKELELRQLKDEYMKLYLQVHDDDKKEQ